jgi:GNAT superfamily N-acetyltransferase
MSRPPRRLPSTKSSLRIRRARPADIAAMSAIRLAVTENGLRDRTRVTPQMYRDYLALLGRGWVCLAVRNIVGFACASQKDASIWALFVAPGHEGLGIGQRLMGCAVDWLFATGATAITLATGRGTRAERFYTEAGWIRDGDDAHNQARFRLALGR